jgi:hypothetical protein
MTRRPALIVRALAQCLLILAASASHAVDFQLSGFGTASVSCFGNDKADYVQTAQPNGPGRTRSCDAGLDSKLGVQADLYVNDRVEFGLQAIADRNTDRTYTPEISVAQLRWHLDESTMIRLGRMPTASLLHAEDRHVRYAQPWVRPPIEVYGLMQASSHDGVDVIHTGTWGNWDTEWHGGLTTSKVDLPLSNSNGVYKLESKTTFLHLSLQQANTTLKLGYAHARINAANATLNALFGQIVASLPEGQALADDLDIVDSDSHLLAFGAKQETPDWLLMSELGIRRVEGFYRNQYGAYVTLGRRLGLWMPYATLARRSTSGPESDSRALGPFKAPVETLLAQTRYDSTSASIGLSREINPQATLKLQADWIRPDKKSWGLYANHAYAQGDPEYLHPSTDWLFSASLDFVF